MSENKQLIPNYVDADFATLKNRLIQLLSENETFKDYDFEGANITILLELISYLGDLNTFYTNKLAKNIHPETADIYEIVHSLVKQQGHEGRGYIAAKVNLDVTVNLVNYDEDGNIINDIRSNIDAGDQLYIPQWFRIDTGLTDDVSGDSIIYSTVNPYYYTVSHQDIEDGNLSFKIKLRQGKPVDIPLEYTGEDLIDNKIILPFKNWDYGDFPYEGDNLSDAVYIGDIEDKWTRLEDFYDDLSDLYTNLDSYMFTYDKYRRYGIVFSGSRNVPNKETQIKIVLLETLGENGNISKNVIVDPPEVSTIFGFPNKPFLKNITKDYVIPVTNYSVSQNKSSYGSSSPQTIDELKESGLVKASSQKRNVTIRDYIGYISDRSDIIKATVWGEKEKNTGSIFEYNKVYISIIPKYWNNQTITTRNVDVTGEFTDDDSDTYVYNSNNIYIEPVDLDEDWAREISRYIEPRKMINFYELYIVPKLVYFRFDFGLRVKRSYDYTSVKNDILSKLEYYFSPEFREFNEIIDFREIYKYLMDSTIKSDTNNFRNILGVDSLVIRDVITYTPSLENHENGPLHIFEQESIQPYNNYPYYIKEVYEDDIENKLKSIKIGFNQFPMLAKYQCTFVNEGR